MRFNFKSKSDYISLNLLLSLSFLPTAFANLWCYSCVSTQPGCGEFGVNWWINRAITCPLNDDKCVKIIERRKGEVQITRDCLSNLIGERSDIPADKFEGCRPAATNNKLAINVLTSIKELDIKRNYWTNVTYCFCELDEWCNSTKIIEFNSYLILATSLLTVIFFLMING